MPKSKANRGHSLIKFRFQERNSMLSKHQRSIVLGSTSPFRRKLLEESGLTFSVAASTADEKTIVDLPPRILARRRAEFKGLDVAQQVPPGSLVIGADQVLSLDGYAFDKAHSAEEAFQRLRQFEGRTHFLHSAFCLIAVDADIKIVYEEVVDVPMTMRRLSHEEILAYVATGEWEGCVGCYRIEGQGVQLFERIGGDHSAIIGLPLTQLYAAMRQF